MSTEERFGKLAELARGVTVQAVDKHTMTTVVYQTVPDRDAIRQLNEYQYGKPAQAVQLQDAAGGPLPVLLMPVVQSPDAKGDPKK